MPPGVMLGSSRETIITPLASGMSITMHSKQPQTVIGAVHDGVERHPLDRLVGIVVDELVDAVPLALDSASMQRPWEPAGSGRWG